MAAVMKDGSSDSSSRSNITNRMTLVLLSVVFLYASFDQVNQQWKSIFPSDTKNIVHSIFFQTSTSIVPTFTDHRRLRREPEFLTQSDQNDNNEPIDPHNQICRNYLKKFLDGSTDSNDECQGLENAYSAADCADDISFMNYNTGVTNQVNDQDKKNGTQPDNTDDGKQTETDDAPTIDDFFQEFQCCKVIQHYYSSRCLYHHQYASLSLLGIVTVLILCNLTKSLLQILQIKWLPEAGGCILVGSVVGAVLTMQLPDYQMNLGTFNPDLFLYILLPPIIFHASLSIDKAKFKKYLFPIMMFAVIGTILSALITGFSVHYLTKALKMVTTTIPLLDSLIFGALISSIDPVAVLSIMHSMGVEDTNMLYVLVFGESILNDGVSIAMFESLVMHLDKSHGDGDAASLDHDLIWSSIAYFWKVSWVSILVGVLTGITCTIYFWSLRGRQSSVAEVASFFCFAMLAYYVSDGIKASGIVSIMVAGIIMDVYVIGFHLTECDTAREFQQEQQNFHGTGDQGASDSYMMGSSDMGGSYVQVQSEERAGIPLPARFSFPSYTDFRVMFSGVGHISNRAKIHVGFVADVLANLMETAIFAYLGLFLFSNKKWDDVPLIIVGIFSCVFSRVIMIGTISLLVNIGGIVQEQAQRILGNSDESNPVPLDDQPSRIYIDKNMQLVLLYSGMRGAVSSALAENIPLFDAVTKHGSQHKQALKAMTSSSIIFTVFFFGASTYYTLKRQRDEQRGNEEVYGNPRSLMTSLLQSHSLEFQQDGNQTPPWVDQTTVSNENNNQSQQNQ